LFDFVAFGLISSLLRQEIGLNERCCRYAGCLMPVRFDEDVRCQICAVRIFTPGLHNLSNNATFSVNALLSRIYTVVEVNSALHPSGVTGSLNRAPASAGVKAGMSPLPGGR